MESVFLHIVRMSVTASILAVAVILLRLLFQKAPKAFTCVLWGFVAIRLIVPISLESPFSLMPEKAVTPTKTVSSLVSEPATVPETTGLVPDHTATAPIEPIIVPGQFTEAPSDDSHIRDTASLVETTADTVVPTTESLSEAAPLASERTPLQTAVFVASILWPVGSICMLLYALLSYLRIQRKVREAVPLQGNLWLCDHMASPFILGVFRPRILLPSSMDPSEMRHVIAHEKAHLKRLDHFWKPLGFLLLSVYWFNPVLWVAYILLCRDIELACDERVVKEMNTEEIKSYSSTLLNYSISRRTISVCPLAFGEVNVKKRIKNVLHYKKPAFWITLASVAVCAVVAVCFLTNPKQDPKETPETSGKPLYTSVSYLDSGSDIDGISLQTKLYGWGASEQPQFTVTWKNETNANYNYCENYDLLYSENGVWSSCAQDLPTFSDTATVLPRKEKQQKMYTLDSFDLSRNGTYRFQAEPEEGSYIWFDFTLQNTTAQDLEALSDDTLCFLVDAILNSQDAKNFSDFSDKIRLNQPLYDALLSGGEATVDCFVRELEQTNYYGQQEYLMALACSEITGIGREEGEYDSGTRWATGKDWLKLYQRAMKNADSKTYENELLSLEYLNHYYNQSASEDRTIELTPYFDIPGLSLSITETDITQITPEGNKTILSYAQIWNGFFYDLNRDFSPELCVTVTTDTELADTRVAVYDFAAGQLYELKEPGTYDYSLLYNYGRFFVYQTGYGNGKTVSHGTPTLAQNETGDYVLQIGPAPEEEYDYMTTHYNKLPVHHLNLMDHCALYSSQAHSAAYYMNSDDRTRFLTRLTFRFDTLEEAENFLSQYSDCVCWVDGGITTIGEQEVIKPYECHFSHEIDGPIYCEYRVTFYPALFAY